MGKDIFHNQAREEFLRIIRQIGSDNLMLFPVRLETHFRKRMRYAKPAGGYEPVATVPQPELCVRIYPDELFLDYLEAGLTDEEIRDGKEFWIRWFIASGGEKREYEAWQVLCDKYAVERAAWIVHNTVIKDVDKYRKGKELFYRRPYQNLGSIDESCNKIYECLAGIVLDESMARNTKTGEYLNEETIRTRLQEIKAHLFQIDRDIMFSEWIVDYLYDSIHTVLTYLSSRLDSFLAFYNRFPGVYSQNCRTLELWDVDFTILKTLRQDVDAFMEKFRGKRISLDKMVDRYLLQWDHIVFEPVKRNTTGHPVMPRSRILPNRFMFIGEPKNHKDELLCRVGERVNPSLQIGYDPNEPGDPYEIDGNGDLKINGKMAWMVDYDQAVKEGMAITVPLPPDVKAFNYIYVIGLRENDGKERELLKSLLQSHNYVDGLSFISSGTPTNQTEGTQAPVMLSREEEMRVRYEIEVEGRAIMTNSNSIRLGSLLGLDARGRGVLDQALGADIEESSRFDKAFHAMWRCFRSRIKDLDHRQDLEDMFDTLENFLVNYVKTRGFFPMVRIGTQPYGILPVTDFENISFIYEPKTPAKIMESLYQTIRAFGTRMKSIRDRQVLHAGNLGSNVYENYLKMTGQVPGSNRVVQRSILEISTLEKTRGKAIGLLQHLEGCGYFDGVPLNETEMPDLSEFRKAIREKIADVSDEEADLYIREFFDLFTYRLDAWYTGFAALLYQRDGYVTRNQLVGRYHGGKRLTDNKEPFAFGAFGWVFDVEWKTPEQKTNPDDLILAPSVQHAITAAILRGAYDKDKDSRLCINLSSMRARQALRMIDGIKEGLSTGVILGADLERYLHDAYKGPDGSEMDQYIYPLRKVFPQTFDIQAEDKRAPNYQMDVINGEALLNSFIDRWNAAGGKDLTGWLSENLDKLEWYKLFFKTLPNGISEDHRKALIRCIVRMQDSYDALNDLLLAEGVHRLAAGDKASFAAISQFMARGSGNLPAPAILQTPLDYAAVSIQCGLALPKNPSQPRHVFAMLDPAINDWVGMLVGSMRNLVLAVIHTDREALSTAYITNLDELGIEPADYLYLSGNDNQLRHLLELRWRLRTGHFDGKVEIVYGNPAETPDGLDFGTEDPAFTLYEDGLRMENLRKLILRSTPMTAAHLAPEPPADTEIANSVDRDELRGRYAAAHTFLVSLEIDLDYLLRQWGRNGRLSDAEVTRALELQADALTSGISQAAFDFDPDLFLDRIDPALRPLDFDAVLGRQGAFMEHLGFIRNEIDGKQGGAGNKAAPNDLYISVEDCIDAMKMLTFSEVVIAPRFSIEPFLKTVEDRTMFSNMVSGTAFSNMDSGKPEAWFDEVAAVRPGARLCQEVRRFQSMAGLPSWQMRPFQWTHRFRTTKQWNRQWLGREVSSEADLDDADALMLFVADRIDTIPPIGNTWRSGLVFDGWMEYIPYMKQAAGAVFHCDQPDAEKPQAILMAAYPQYCESANRDPWTIEKLADVLDSTRFMLMNRSVDAEMVLGSSELSKETPILNTREISVANYLGTVDLPVRSAPPTPRNISWAEESADPEIFGQMPGGYFLIKSINY